jgi:hypothetical protein
MVAVTEATIRWKWLNAMYVYTAVGAGLLGLAMLLAPNLVATYLQMPIQDPVVLGVVGSAYLAFASASILGLRFSLRFIPILMPQLIYKSVWLVVPDAVNIHNMPQFQMQRAPSVLESKSTLQAILRRDS